MRRASPRSDRADISRRQFLGTSAAAGATALVVPGVARAERTPTLTDLVPLGKTGYKICRLGMGTGSNGGRIQRDLGQEGFTRLVRHGWDRGVRFIDTAHNYGTHAMVREAIQGLPREKLWLQTKMPWDRRDLGGIPKKPLEVLDRYRKELGVDYIDSLLIHCATTNTWHDDLKRMRDAFVEAKEKKLVRVYGLSCHGLPALRAAERSEWPLCHLVRVNPQGRHVDGAMGKWGEPGKPDEAFPVIRKMQEKGRGMIGMKIIGNGDFKELADRQRSMRHALECGFLDCFVIGFGSAAQIDEAIAYGNKVLAGA